MSKFKLSLGWNRVNPRHELLATDGGFIQCSKLQNYICGRNCITKVGGTEAYNGTSLGSDYGIPWVERSYHLRGDGSIVKRLHAYYGGAIYYGDDVNGTLTQTNVTSLSPTAIPLSFSFQVAGNSIIYMCTGSGTIHKYDGNGSFQWEQTNLDTDIINGVDHLQRVWYWHQKSSLLSYSSLLDPETIEDDILCGDNAKDSFVVSCIKTGNERFFIFKNNSIYELSGRTPSSFALIRVSDRFGLASKRAWFPWRGGIIFLNENDKELYFFGGTESSITPLTEDDIRLREILDTTEDEINKICMTIHENLFRMSFKYTGGELDGNICELVFPINELRADGKPKWSLLKGTNVYSYTQMNKYSENNYLLTGRSDIGKVMYHNRGHNFDNLPIETVMRTAEIVASDENVMVFGDFFIKGKPDSNSHPIDFRYFINGRTGDYASTPVIPKGETRTAGLITIQKSDLFNDRIVPEVLYRRGNSIAFEIYDNTLDTNLELYSIAFSATDRYKIRNQYV